MQIDVVEAPPGGVEADVLVFAVRDPVVLAGAAEGLDRLVEGRLARLVDSGELKGDEGRVTLLHADGRLAAAAGRRGRRSAARTLDADRLRTAAARVAARTLDVGGTSVAWVVEENGLAAEEQGRAIVDGTVLGPYANGRWKTGAEGREIERLVLCGPGAGAAAEAARRANVAATWANRCRDVVNAPANELTPGGPRRLGGGDRRRQRASPLRGARAGGDPRRRAWARSRRSARGATTRPRLITLAYEPPGPARPDQRVGLVGKAITFDCGRALAEAGLPHGRDEVGHGRRRRRPGRDRRDRRARPADPHPRRRPVLREPAAAGTPSGRATSSRR